MADIRKILGKKSWTGRELGILELTNMAVMFRQALEGKEPQPIIDQANFRAMINSITDRQQGQVYSGYISIHEWLSIRYNTAQTQMQQAQLQYRTLSGYITDATLAEDIYCYIEQLPAIMTEKQYQDAREAGLHNWLYDEDGTERRDSLPALIERGIFFYTEQLRKAPAKANPLKKIRKKYIAEPVRSRHILESYNEVMGEGYYTLPDGRRSDQMSIEEWRAVLDRIDEEAERNYAREKPPYGDVVSRLLIDKRVTEATALYNGATEEEANEAASKLSGLGGVCTWHTREEPPEGLTKWDIVESGLLEFYGLIFCGMDGSEEEYLEELEDFLTEFKELADAIIADIEKLYLTGKGQLQPLPVNGREPLMDIAGLPLKDWRSTVFSSTDLYKLDVYGYRKELEADTVIFDGNKRAVLNGIAILRASNLSGRSPRINESGYYVEPDMRHTLSNFTLEAFFPEAEDYADNVEIVEDARRVLKESYYYLKGYNLSLDMIARYYDVPELAIFKMPVDGIEDKMQAFNGLVPILYKKIRDTDYGDKDLKERKLQVLKDLFQPIEYETLTIPEESREQAEQLLEGFKAFQPEHTALFDKLLYILPEDEDGEGA